jgi:hypothetical protein
MAVAHHPLRGGGVLCVCAFVRVVVAIILGSVSVKYCDFVIGRVSVKSAVIGVIPYIRMENAEILKTPKKRAPVKRTASIAWHQDTQEKQCQELKLEELVQQLQKRLTSLESAVQLQQEAMDHLLAEDFTDSILSEDDQN